MLREKVSELSPRASQVMDHQKAWLEAAPAVDPSTWPQQMLLHCMQPSTSSEVSITHWEWTPERMSIIGRMPDASLALQYTQEVATSEALAHFNWEVPAPVIASDNSATFEMKGGKPDEKE